MAGSSMGGSSRTMRRTQTGMRRIREYSIPNPPSDNPQSDNPQSDNPQSPNPKSNTPKTNTPKPNTPKQATPKPEPQPGTPRPPPPTRHPPPPTRHPPPADPLSQPDPDPGSAKAGMDNAPQPRQMLTR